MKKQILIALLPVLFACSCKTAKKTSSDASAVHVELITDETFRKPVVDKELFKSTTDVVLLDTVYIAKDTLNIITKKITGCETDNFKLIWNGDLGSAIPAQTSVKLFQLVEGACKEHHKFHLTYNISPLKLKADTSAVKTTLIRVGGWARMTSFVHN